MNTNTKRLLAVMMVVACMAAMLAGCGGAEAPDAGFVQMGNPLVEVASASEMEEKLGHSVPVLDKEVETYIVLVIDGKADTGRIHYKDGSLFNIKKGSGDISGIYGGTLESEQAIGGVTVSFYRYEGQSYAIWADGGFTYSLSRSPTLQEDVAALIGG